MSNAGFSTKKYTINLLISEVSSLTPSSFSSVKTLTSALSPRTGATSAKVAALNSFLNGNLTRIVNGTGNYSSFGKTPRTRIVRALRARKSFRN